MVIIRRPLCLRYLDIEVTSSVHAVVQAEEDLVPGRQVIAFEEFGG